MAKKIYDMIMSVRRMVAEPKPGFFTDQEIVEFLDSGLRQVIYKIGGIETTGTKTSVTSQQEYSMPADCLTVKMVTFDGKPIRPIDLQGLQVENGFGVNSSSTGVPASYYIYNQKIGLYPIPDATNASKTIKFYYSKRPVAISSTAFALSEPYSTGTVSVTSGNFTVTGASTRWDVFASAGQFFGRKADSKTSPAKWYTISQVASATSVVLTSAYQDTASSQTAQVYVITDQCSYDDEIINCVEQYAIWKSALKYKDPVLSAMHKAEYENSYQELLRKYNKPHKQQNSRVLNRDSYPNKYFDGPYLT